MAAGAAGQLSAWTRAMQPVASLPMYDPPGARGAAPSEIVAGPLTYIAARLRTCGILRGRRGMPREVNGCGAALGSVARGLRMRAPRAAIEILGVEK